MKKIIFFDGDGTLWQPKDTKKYPQPWDVYADKTADVFEEMRVVPKAAEVLQTIGNKGLIRVLLSTSSLPKEQAMEHRRKMVAGVGLSGLLDKIYSTIDYQEAKGEMILKILKAYKLHKKDALMVGDMYKWDCKPAQDVGVDALLINRPYSFKHFENVRLSSVRQINRLDDILTFI